MTNLEYIASYTLPGTSVQGIMFTPKYIYYIDATLGIVRYELLTGEYVSESTYTNCYGIVLFKNELYAASYDGYLRIYDADTLTYRGAISLGIDITAYHMTLYGHYVWIACGTHLLKVNLVSRETEVNVNHANSCLDVLVSDEQLAIVWPGRGVVSIADEATQTEQSTITTTDEPRALCINDGVISIAYLGGVELYSANGESYDSITEINGNALTSANLIRYADDVLLIAYSDTMRVDFIYAYHHTETVGTEDSIVGSTDIIVGQDDLDVGTQTYVEIEREALPKYAYTVTRD